MMNELMVFLALGIAANTKRNYDEALMYFDKALTINPKYMDALSRKAGVLIHLKKFEEAMECFDKMLMANPEEMDALTGKGDIFLCSKEYDRAIKYFDGLLEIYPNSYHILIRLGLAIYGEDNAEDALPYYERALKIQPNAEQALKLKETALKTLFKNANALYEVKKYDQALKIYEKIIASAIEEKMASYKKDALNKKKVLFLLQQLPMATRQKRSILHTLFNLENSFLPIQRQAEASFIYQRIIEFISDDMPVEILNFKIDAFIELAQIYKNQEQLELAIEACQAAVKLNPNVVPGLNTLGNIFLSQGKYQQALDLFNQALETDDAKSQPTLQATLWRNKIGVYQKMADVKNIIACCTEFLKLSPNNKEILYVKGSTILGTIRNSFSIKDLLEGLITFSKAISQEQDGEIKQENEKKLLTTAANLIAALASKVPASELETCVQFVSDYAESKSYLAEKLFMVTYNYGFSYAQQNNHAKAAFYFTKATDLNPSFSDAWQNAFACYNNYVFITEKCSNM